MNKFVVITIVCLFLIANINSQTTGWSTWAECTESQRCFRRRTFTCDAGEGIECLNEADGAFEQVALDCDANPECLENATKMFHASEVRACCCSSIVFILQIYNLCQSCKRAD